MSTTDTKTAAAGHPYHHGALRAQMMEATVAAIERDGVDAVSLRRLAREAGVSPAAPYHHFPDRAALFAAIMGEGQSMLYERLAAACAAAPDAAHALTGMLVAYADFAAEHPGHMRLMLRPEAGHPEQHPENFDSRQIDILREQVLAAQAEGALPAGDPEPWLHLLWSVAVGYVALWLYGPVELRTHALGTTPQAMIRRMGEAINSVISSRG